MAMILVVIYGITAALGGSVIEPDLTVLYPILQVNSAVWKGAVWMLFTAMFLHADILHLGGNVFFLLLFGTALEEQVSVQRWLITYLGSGLVGNLTFLLLGGNAIGLGASGAIWGLLAAAGGVRGLVGMVFYGGLNIFAGGGFLGHAGGLVAGLVLRFYWTRVAR
jgi:membrane associated rhomboid family serine protease